MLNSKTLGYIILILGLSAVATPSLALDNTAANTTYKTVELQKKSTGKPIQLKNGSFMRSTYRDVKVNLVGPVNFTIEDEFTRRRFQNLYAPRAQPAFDPGTSGPMIPNKFYKSTVAKAGFKIKF